MTGTTADGFIWPDEALPSAIEAVLFASGDPVSMEKLREVTGAGKAEIAAAAELLAARYEKDPMSGLAVRKLEDEYVICTKPAMKAVLDRFFQPGTRPPMSQATVPRR